CALRDPLLELRRLAMQVVAIARWKNPDAIAAAPFVRRSLKQDTVVRESRIRNELGIFEYIDDLVVELADLMRPGPAQARHLACPHCLVRAQMVPDEPDDLMPEFRITRRRLAHLGVGVAGKRAEAQRLEAEPERVEGAVEGVVFSHQLELSAQQAQHVLHGE